MRISCQFIELNSGLNSGLNFKTPLFCQVKNWEKIKKTPTVKLYKAGQVVQVIEGTDKNKITAAIAKYNGTGL